MCGFKPGDEVVCVDDTFEPFSPVLRPVWRGELHTVSGLYSDETGVWLRFEGFDQNDGFNPVCFRKVQKRKDSLTLESFLTIKPGQFEEPKRPSIPSKTREGV